MIYTLISFAALCQASSTTSPPTSAFLDAASSTETGSQACSGDSMEQQIKALHNIWFPPAGAGSSDNCFAVLAVCGLNNADIPKNCFAEFSKCTGFKESDINDYVQTNYPEMFKPASPYAIGAENLKSCPDKSIAIDTEEGCKAYAVYKPDFLEDWFFHAKKFDGKHPSKCILFGGWVFYNDDTLPVTQFDIEGAQPICVETYDLYVVLSGDGDCLSQKHYNLGSENECKKALEYLPEKDLTEEKNPASEFKDNKCMYWLDVQEPRGQTICRRISP